MPMTKTASEKSSETKEVKDSRRQRTWDSKVVSRRDGATESRAEVKSPRRIKSDKGEVGTQAAMNEVGIGTEPDLISSQSGEKAMEDKGIQTMDPLELERALQGAEAHSSKAALSEMAVQADLPAQDGPAKRSIQCGEMSVGTDSNVLSSVKILSPRSHWESHCERQAPADQTIVCMVASEDGGGGPKPSSSLAADSDDGEDSSPEIIEIDSSDELMDTVTPPRTNSRLSSKRSGSSAEGSPELEDCARHRPVTWSWTQDKRAMRVRIPHRNTEMEEKEHINGAAAATAHVSVIKRTPEKGASPPVDSKQSQDIESQSPEVPPLLSPKPSPPLKNSARRDTSPAKSDKSKSPADKENSRLDPYDNLSPKSVNLEPSSAEGDGMPIGKTRSPDRRAKHDQTPPEKEKKGPERRSRSTENHKQRSPAKQKSPHKSPDKHKSPNRSPHKSRTTSNSAMTSPERPSTSSHHSNTKDCSKDNVLILSDDASEPPVLYMEKNLRPKRNRSKDSVSSISASEAEPIVIPTDTESEPSSHRARLGRGGKKKKKNEQDNNKFSEPDSKRQRSERTRERAKKTRRTDPVMATIDAVVESTMKDKTKNHANNKHPEPKNSKQRGKTNKDKAKAAPPVNLVELSSDSSSESDSETPTTTSEDDNQGVEIVDLVSDACDSLTASEYQPLPDLQKRKKKRKHLGNDSGDDPPSKKKKKKKHKKDKR